MLFRSMEQISNSTIVETNTYYEGDRYTTAQHLSLIHILPISLPASLLKIIVTMASTVVRVCLFYTSRTSTGKVSACEEPKQIG